MVGLFNADNRITPGKIIDALEAGGKGTITVASACTMAGIVAGCITSTGLASKLLRAIVSASGGVMIIALLSTMVTLHRAWHGRSDHRNLLHHGSNLCSILMSPEIGVEMLAAHFFVFYFGIVADITAGGTGCLRRRRHRKGRTDEDRIQRKPPCHRRLYCTVYHCHEPGYAVHQHHHPEVVMITITSIIGIFGVAAG